MAALAADPLLSYARAHRAHEHLTLMATVHGKDAFGKWVAIFLGDGSCDTRLYASKGEAVRFQRHETQCAYLCLNGVPTLGETRLYLDTCEDLYDQGLQLADPETYVNPETFL